jgi:signal transduction histidine kinase
MSRLRVHNGFITNELGSSRARKGGSIGCGLFLIKRMMEVYGWTIQESGIPGQGVLFTITIPEMNPKGKQNFRIT